jgi:hypothetical protein
MIRLAIDNERKAAREDAREPAAALEPMNDAPEPGAKCWCETCWPPRRLRDRMIVCPDCHNKRCPRANWHGYACTGSNEVGQKGSSWEHVKAPEPVKVIPQGVMGIPPAPDIRLYQAVQSHGGKWPTGHLAIFFDGLRITRAEFMKAARDTK